MCAPKAPAPPDPYETAAAQTGTNVATALANNATAMVNQVTPDGSLTYDQTGTYSFTDPNSGQTYDLPTWTATTTLSPEQQAIQEQNRGAQLNLASLANEQAGYLRDYLGDTGAVTDQIDAKLYDLGASRLDPRFAREEDALRTRLANQGIAPGSEAYNRELSQFSQGRNDAYNSLLLSGRNQAMAEVNAPINRITALLSGSQVSNPNVAMTQPGGFAPANIAGAINANYDQRLNNWETAMQQRQGILGGLFNVAGKAMTGGFAPNIIYN